MSELSPDEQAWNEEIYPDNEEYIDPETLDDYDAYDVFFSELSHFSARRETGVQTAEHIRTILGLRLKDELSDEAIAWRTRMMKLMKYDSDRLSDKKIDELRLSGEKYDEPFATIFNTLIATRDNAEQLAEERKALLLLKDLRIGAIVAGYTTDEANKKWMDVLARLNPPDTV